jgi:hypothetical protein
VLRKRVALLVAAAVLVLSMLAAAAPAFAQECSGASCEQNPGNTEASRSNHSTPPLSKPGASRRDTEANEHDTGIDTGRGKRFSQ